MALGLEWRSSNRFLVLVADAPCHGVEYSGGHGRDSYPDGNPDGLDARDVFEGIKRLRLQQFIFTKLTHFTDVMIAKFARMHPILQIDLQTIDCISQFGVSLSTEIAGHIRPVQ